MTSFKKLKNCIDPKLLNGIVYMHLFIFRVCHCDANIRLCSYTLKLYLKRAVSSLEMKPIDSSLREDLLDVGRPFPARSFKISDTL